MKNGMKFNNKIVPIGMLNFSILIYLIRRNHRPCCSRDQCLHL